MAVVDVVAAVPTYAFSDPYGELPLINYTYTTLGDPPPAAANFVEVKTVATTYSLTYTATSDDPSRYRPKDDADRWPLGDPIERLKQHLIALGEWSEERHAALAAELGELVGAAWKEATNYGTLTEGPRLDPDLMFEDVFKDMPRHLVEQREQLRRERT